MQICKTFKAATLTITILSSSQLLSMEDFFATKEQQTENRKKRRLELGRQAEKNKDFAHRSYCFLEYLKQVRESQEFDLLSFQGMFAYMQETASIRTERTYEQVTHWNYYEYPLFIAATKKIKRSIKEEYKSAKKEEKKSKAKLNWLAEQISDADHAIAIIEQFNKGKEHPLYGAPLFIK